MGERDSRYEKCASRIAVTLGIVVTLATLVLLLNYLRSEYRGTLL